jgi:hypothetical protein
MHLLGSKREEAAVGAPVHKKGDVMRHGRRCGILIKEVILAEVLFIQGAIGPGRK